MKYFNQRGVSLVAVLIITIVVGVFVGGAFMLLNQERAKVRDAKRLSDITRLQAVFEFLYNDTASYILAAQNGCDRVGSSASQCSLANYLPNIRNLKDPLASNKFQYLVSQVPSEDNYEITFYLEKDYQEFKAGRHILTPEGIK